MKKDKDKKKATKKQSKPASKVNTQTKSAPKKQADKPASKTTAKQAKTVTVPKQESKPTKQKQSSSKQTTAKASSPKVTKQPTSTNTQTNKNTATNQQNKTVEQKQLAKTTGNSSPATNNSATTAVSTKPKATTPKQTQEKAQPASKPAVSQQSSKQTQNNLVTVEIRIHNDANGEPSVVVSHVGEIHRGNTKYIDTEPKKQRNYAVVKDKNGNITVAKIKTIKQIDESGKNADKHLVEIKHENYGLEERSGVDNETFDTNRMSKKPLRLEDKDAFPEGKPRAKLNSKDKHNVLIHTKIINPPKNKKGGNS